MSSPPCFLASGRRTRPYIRLCIAHAETAVHFPGNARHVRRPSAAGISPAVAVRREDGRLWLRQATDDYRFGRAALRGRFYAQACFVAQLLASYNSWAVLSFGDGQGSRQAPSATWLDAGTHPRIASHPP